MLPTSSIMIHVDNYIYASLSCLYIQYAHIRMNTYIYIYIAVLEHIKRSYTDSIALPCPRFRVCVHTAYFRILPIHTPADVPPIAPLISHAYFTFNKKRKMHLCDENAMRGILIWPLRCFDISRRARFHLQAGGNDTARAHRKAPIYSREYYVTYPHVHHARNRWDSVKCALTLSLSRACTCLTV